jgi:hypothetical protein
VIESEESFDFLSELVASIPDVEPPKVERRGRPRRSKEETEGGAVKEKKVKAKRAVEGNCFHFIFEIFRNFSND